MHVNVGLPILNVKKNVDALLKEAEVEKKTRTSGWVV